MTSLAYLLAALLIPCLTLASTTCQLNIQGNWYEGGEPSTLDRDGCSLQCSGEAINIEVSGGYDNDPESLYSCLQAAEGRVELNGGTLVAEEARPLRQVTVSDASDVTFQVTIRNLYYASDYKPFQFLNCNNCIIELDVDNVNVELSRATASLVWARGSSLTVGPGRIINFNGSILSSEDSNITLTDLSYTSGTLGVSSAINAARGSLLSINNATWSGISSPSNIPFLLAVNVSSVSVTHSSFTSMALPTPTNMTAFSLTGARNVKVSNTSWHDVKAANVLVVSRTTGPVMMTEPSFTNCLGVPLWYERCSAASSSARACTISLHNASFTNNTVTAASATSAAIHIVSSGVTLSISSSRFTFNRALNGAGSLAISRGNLTITDSVFGQNTGSLTGAVLMSNMFATSISSCSFMKNRCSSSSSAQPPSGGSLSATVTNSSGPAWNFLLMASNFTENDCYRGGAASFNMLTSVQVLHSVFTRNTADLSGAAVAFVTETTSNLWKGPYRAILKNSTFEGNIADVEGSAVQAEALWTASVEDCTFNNNGKSSSMRGGAMRLQGCPQAADPVQIIRSSFTNNKAAIGGSIQTEGCNMTVVGSIFVNNTSEQFGAAIYVSGYSLAGLSTLKVRSSTFYRNKAVLFAGAVYVNQQAFTSDNATYEHNSAGSGGAVLVYGASAGAIDSLFTSSVSFSESARAALRAIITSSSFINNHGTETGGGLLVDKSAVTLVDVTFSGNTAGDEPAVDQWAGSGGALSATSCYGALRVTACRFNNNRGFGSGGAISAQACLLVVAGSVFGSNTAYLSGGSLFFANPRRLGAAEIIINSSNFTANVAESNDGGAIYTRQGSISIASSRFSANSAEAGSGGALAADRNRLVILDATSFHENRALSGGAVFASRATIVTVAGGDLVNNVAELKGGAVSVQFPECAMVVSTVFDGNRANDAAGLHVQLPRNASSDVLSGGYGNCSSELRAQLASYGNLSAVGSNLFEGRPAGIIGQQQGNVSYTVVVHQVRATRNHANRYGGAVALDGGVGAFLFDSITVGNNSAQSGGGIAVLADETQRGMELQVVVASSVITGNSASNAEASGCGGGVLVSGRWARQQQMHITNTTMDLNAAQEGGAICLEGNVSLLFSGSNATGNYASDNGGAIKAIACNELHVSGNSSLSGNVAGQRGGGVDADGCALVLLDSAAFEANIALSAGGVYVHNEVEGLNATAAASKGATVAVVTKCAFAQNSAASTNDEVKEGYGGGIWISDRVAALVYETNFTANNASIQGGALMVDSSCNLTDAPAFLIGQAPEPLLFRGARSLMPSVLRTLAGPRTNRCWGVLTYLIKAANNFAGSNGGTFFSSRPESLALVCAPPQGSAQSTADSTDPITDADLGADIRSIMHRDEFQKLNLKGVSECYFPDASDADPTMLLELFEQISDITSSRAKYGYGPFVGIVPSKIAIARAAWNANASVTQINSADSSSVSEVGRPLSSTNTLLDAPQLTSSYGTDGGGGTRYRLLTISNEAMDFGVDLMDALDQLAIDGRRSHVRMATVVATKEESRCSFDLSGITEANAYSGSAVLSGMRVRARKGSNYTITISLADTEFESSVKPLRVDVEIPPCRVGEVPRDDGFVCEQCDALTYSLWEDIAPLDDNCEYQNLDDVTCKPCPLNAECPGGAVIFPDQGAWHSAANSSYFIMCPNPEACRDTDDEMQAALQQCQAWWYSQQLGFDYHAYVNSILEGNSTLYPDAPGASNGTYNESACALWGLPYLHPAAYMTQQCAEGYAGQLCGTCAPIDQLMYASNADFECNECVPRSGSIALAVVFFVFNILIILVTVLLTFFADYTEDEELAVGDILKVVIVHCQYFIIITRFNIAWPNPVMGLASVFGVVTGAVKQVFTPSCLLGINASSAVQAQAEVFAGLISPFVLIGSVCIFWVLRYLLWNGRDLSEPAPQRNMRLLSEVAEERRLSQQLPEEPQQQDKKRMRLAHNPKVGDVEPSQSPDAVDVVGDLLDLSADLHEEVLAMTQSQKEGKMRTAAASLSGKKYTVPSTAMSSHTAGDPGNTQQQQEVMGVPVMSPHTLSVAHRRAIIPHDGGESHGGADDSTLQGGPKPFESTGTMSASRRNTRVSFNDKRLYKQQLEDAPNPFKSQPARRSLRSDSLTASDACGSPASGAATSYTSNSTTRARSNSSTRPSSGSQQLHLTRKNTAEFLDGGKGEVETVFEVEELPEATSVCKQLNGRPSAGSVGSIANQNLKSSSKPPGDVEAQEEEKLLEANSVCRQSNGRTSAGSFVSGVNQKLNSSSGQPPGDAEAQEEGKLPEANSICRPSNGRTSAGSGGYGANQKPSPSGKPPGDVEAQEEVENGGFPLWRGVRNFFDMTGEEGEARWAALINIDRTMTLWRQVLLVTMIACFILYPAWAQAALQIFACYYLDEGTGSWPEYQLAQSNNGYWIRDMNQECYTGDHARMWVPIGVTFIVVVCIGIPLLSFFAIHTHRKTLDTVHVAQTYGFIYRRYNDVRYYWQAVSQVQTLLLVVVDVFGRVLPVYQRAVLLQVMLVLTMTMNTYFEPTKFPLLERMEFLSLAVLSVTVSMGLFFVRPVGQKDPIRPAAGILIAVIILVLNIGICLYFLFIVWTNAQESINNAYNTAREKLLVAHDKIKWHVSDMSSTVTKSTQNFQEAVKRSVTSVVEKVGRRSSTMPSLPEIPGLEEEEEVDEEQAQEAKPGKEMAGSKAEGGVAAQQGEVGIAIMPDDVNLEGAEEAKTDRAANVRAGA